MKAFLNTPAGTIHAGTELRILSMDGITTPSKAFPDGIDHQAEQYKDKTGTVLFIDDIDQIHGTWGGLALIPGVDKFEIINT